MFEGDLFCLCRPVSSSQGGGRWMLLARSQLDCPKYTVGSGVGSGQCRWARRMGNQQGKGGKRAAPGQTYPFDEPEKKSRTDWTAGNPGL